MGVTRLNADKPIVWVYSGNPRYAPVPTPIDSIVVIRAAIDALKDAPVHVVLTTGFQDMPAELGTLPANFSHAPYLPGKAMAAKCDLMVHHVMPSRRKTVRAVTAAVLAALLVSACTVERTPDGLQVCQYSSAGIACTLTPIDRP